jgi:hypothetical protein
LDVRVQFVASSVVVQIVVSLGFALEYDIKQQRVFLIVGVPVAWLWRNDFGYLTFVKKFIDKIRRAYGQYVGVIVFDKLYNGLNHN